MFPKRYTISNLKSAISNPEKFARELRRIVTTGTYSPYYVYHKKKFYSEHSSPEDIVDRDWDYLFILDACRFDKFKELNWIDGSLEYTISGGSHSKGFAKYNFENERLHDTVYVTANAHAARISQGSFHDLIFTEKNECGSWATRNGMHPANVAESALSAYEKYPNKRLIIHFMQPHSPYFGEIGGENKRKIK